jgi:hypothetical protein
MVNKELRKRGGLRLGFSLLLFCCASSSAFGFEVECKATPVTEITVSDVVAKGGTHVDVRRSLIDTAVDEGIKTVIGVQIQSRSASSVSSSSGEIKEAFLERMRAQSGGYGRPVVLGESVKILDGQTLLELRVEVTVCVPKNPMLVKRIVAIRSALNSRGEELEDFRTIIEKEISSSSAFAVATKESGDFADINVEGRILDHGVTGRVIKGKRYNRISVTYALSGEVADDGSVVTHTGQEFSNVLASLDVATAANRFMVESLSRGTRRFHDKLLTVFADTKKAGASVQRSDEARKREFGIVDGKLTIAVYPPVGPGVTAIKRRRFDAMEISRRLEEALRATGRFALFERDAELLASSVESEQDLAESGSFLADAAERGKLANVKLIVQPFVAQFGFGPRFRSVDGLPGMYERTDYGKVTLTSKVLDTTSGEIKYQITIPWVFSRNSGNVYKGKVGGPGQKSWLRMAEEVGTRSAAAIVNSVFPIMVIKVSRGRIFLNRGKGGGVSVGDVLELFSVGEELKDPQTGESLGGEEYSIGKIKVSKISTKFSTALPVKILEDEAKRGDIAR